MVQCVIVPQLHETQDRAEPLRSPKSPFLVQWACILLTRGCVFSSQGHVSKPLNEQANRPSTNSIALTPDHLKADNVRLSRCVLCSCRNVRCVCVDDLGAACGRAVWSWPCGRVAADGLRRACPSDVRYYPVLHHPFSSLNRFHPVLICRALLCHFAQLAPCYFDA